MSKYNNTEQACERLFDLMSMDTDTNSVIDSGGVSIRNLRQSLANILNDGPLEYDEDGYMWYNHIQTHCPYFIEGDS